MFRIIALNESNGHNYELNDESSLTQEAEETIAESEYVRAIRFNNQGKELYTLTLLHDLLKTKVLHEISVNNKNDKLWSIRYNCYKNIAVIYEKRNDFSKALQNYILAVKLDDRDIFTMNRLGHLALRMNAFEIAEFAFERCLRRNKNHWPAIDGILKLLFRKQNIFGLYDWAIKFLSMDIKYKRALDVINTIRNTFPDAFAFYKIMWNDNLPKHIVQKPCVYILHDCSNSRKMSLSISKQDNLHELDEINWLSLGKYIAKMYTNLNGSKTNMLYILELSTIYKSAKTDFQKWVDLEMKEEFRSYDSSYSKVQKCISLKNIEIYELNLPLNESTIFLNHTINKMHSIKSVQLNETEMRNGETDLSFKTDSNENNKTKPRRRCSDLHFLEQWGWHKNRRYSSRKKNLDRSEIDTSLKGFLHRIYFQYLKSFDTTCPFTSDIESNVENIKTQYEYNEADILMQDFQKQTQNYFKYFLVDLQSNPSDLLSLMHIWLKYVSAFWKIAIPVKLKETYISVYTLYVNHIDFLTWNQFFIKDINIWYDISIFFLELEYASAENKKCDVTILWKSVLKHLSYYSGIYLLTEGNHEVNIIRLIYMEYCIRKHEDDLIKSIDYLKKLELLLENQNNDFILLLPHLRTYICKELVCITRTDLERKVSLARVPKLVQEQNWQELIAIICDNLMHSTHINGYEYLDRDLQTQFQVLLMSFWNACDLEKCLTWSEMCLQYSVHKYLSDMNISKQQSFWSGTINYILTYIEAIILREGCVILNCLGENLSRLVQNIISILCLQLDAPFDKHNNPKHELDFKQPFVVLHQIILRDENNSLVKLKNKTPVLTSDAQECEDSIPHSFLVLFTAHEFLGKRYWCTRDSGAFLLYILDVITPNLRAPIFDSFRDILYEHLEQVTYCLYGFPPRKSRYRHIEDHESKLIEITWRKAIQLIDLYRPECLPEFNSYKLESVSSDMEQLLIKIVSLINKEIDTVSGVCKIKQFIRGERESLPAECIALPYKISCVFYLLADYYFKNRDFSKTIKYYTLDLACNPTRFDSWAGIALSKASKIETKLNDFQQIELSRFLNECDETIRCFEQCIQLHNSQTLLWIEYGSFAYSIHSFCSRHLKQFSHKMSLEHFTCVEERKEKMLNIAFNCFSLAATLQNRLVDHNSEFEESNEETWLCQYMLGKISEKRKEKPKVCINHYLKAAHFLYENNATYPIKINHSNPTSLSVEALEIFYRINAVIIKYLEHEREIDKETRNIFRNVIKNLSKSPFAFNKAKIDGNCLNVLKRNMNEMQSESQAKKMKQEVIKKKTTTEITSTILVDEQSFGEHENERIRRKSNESFLTSESSDSESASNLSYSNCSATTSNDSESDLDFGSNCQSHEDLICIYNNVIQNLEECVTRFPEHYKSSYRLVYHYMNGPEALRNLDCCEQLLLSQYTTSLGNQINGIFFDRKGNNIFNGIWRLPSSEIDRPGSFSNHLVKCITILIQLLRKKNNYKLLIDVGLQLYKTPDNDKRYIKDLDRMELYHQSINFCVQVMRDIFKKITCYNDDNETLNLLIDIYKTHKKCVKHLNQKEPIFSQLLIDVYKYFIHNKVEKIPEQINLSDLAIKLCLQEMSARKNKEKTNMNENLHGNRLLPNNSEISQTIQTNTKIPGFQIKNNIQLGGSAISSDIIPDQLSCGASVTNVNYQNSLPTYGSMLNPIQSMSITNTVGINNFLRECNMFKTESTTEVKEVCNNSNKPKTQLPTSFKINYSQSDTSNSNIDIISSTYSKVGENSSNRIMLSIAELNASNFKDTQQLLPKLYEMNIPDHQSINTLRKHQIICKQTTLTPEKYEELNENTISALYDNSIHLPSTQRLHSNQANTYTDLITTHLMSQQRDMQQTSNNNGNSRDFLKQCSDMHLIFAENDKNSFTSAYSLSHSNTDLPSTLNNYCSQIDKVSSANKKLISSEKNVYQAEFLNQCPGKTLQQKLAERKRANKQHDLDGSEGSKYIPSSDVIILD